MYSRILSRRQMAVWCITLSGALALCIGLQGLLGWGRTQLDTGAALAADTLRLHIRAASDTTADQTDKLAVRDAVLAYLDTACPAADQPAALRWAAAHLSELQRVARTVLAGRGSFAPVRVYLVEMYFGTTRYSASALPAGRYQALRIDIGAAPYGRNWWCVLYTASAAPPAAAMPPPPRTTSSAGSISCGSNAWSGGRSTPPAEKMSSCLDKLSGRRDLGRRVLPAGSAKGSNEHFHLSPHKLLVEGV